MSRLLLTLCLALLLVAGSGRVAGAQRLILSVSQPEVLITSNFAGADLVLFGVVEGTPGADKRYDFAVTVRGPEENFRHLAQVADRRHLYQYGQPHLRGFPRGAGGGHQSPGG